MVLGTALLIATVATVGGSAVLVGAGYVIYKMVDRIVANQEF